MDTVKAKRIAKKTAKHTFWIASDVFFLGLKIVGAFALIAVAAVAIYTCFFLYYLNNEIATGFEIDSRDFTMARSSVISYIDSHTGREIELVTIQSTEFRRWASYDEFPDHLINALISIEDHRFFSHQGVDWYRTAGAFMNMFLGMRDTFGGSTITQQVIKNLTHEDDATVQRKLQEIFRALEYEKQFNKEEILELYLNLVYFGHGTYGIGAAAYYYFNKEVSELTLPEAASIISITNNPSRFSPYANRESNKERQEIILRRMYELGYIRTEQELNQALRSVLHFQRGIDDNAEQVIYTWFEEAVMRDVVSDLVTRLGYSEQVARRLLHSGGLRIIATIDPTMQAIVDEIYQNPENLPEVTGNTQQRLQSGVILADPYTGEIKALVGGVGVKTRNMLLSRATQTRRPPGSAIKPIAAYAPALEYGMLTPDTIYNDSADIELSGTTWLPRNASRRYQGEVSVRYALRHSINTVAAMVVDQLTPRSSFLFMRDVLRFNLDPQDENYAPLAAGQLTWGATVREMASAYTMFPNDGVRVELRTYSMIYNYNGEILLDNTAPIENVAINDVTAFWMTDMLRDVVLHGTGGSASLGAHMPVAGKTGTTTNSEDRWFVGFTPYYLAAVWTGFDTPVEMVSSGNPAAQIWRMIMDPIHADLETKSFNTPRDVELQPVINPWEFVTAFYTVRAVDVHGEILFEDVIRSTVGAEVIEDAPEILGYVLQGQAFGAITLTADSNRNIILFIYMSEEEYYAPPPDPDQPEDPYDPLDPNSINPNDTPP
ncbi:MAG: PBP1A family penicillin-binding protein [Oscillospiraceae bacterium]|jgi:penicillin-binding protein 1A|nr:PBP1A family penicillin-binding protein [Oscillospiraceae bacterium]